MQASGLSVPAVVIIAKRFVVKLIAIAAHCAGPAKRRTKLLRADAHARCAARVRAQTSAALRCRMRSTCRAWQTPRAWQVRTCSALACAAGAPTLGVRIKSGRLKSLKQRGLKDRGSGALTHETMQYTSQFPHHKSSAPLKCTIHRMCRWRHKHHTRHHMHACMHIYYKYAYQSIHSCLQRQCSYGYKPNFETRD